MVELLTYVVLTCAQFDELTAIAPVDVVVDVENRGDDPSTGTLLGVAVSFEVEGTQPTAFYVPFYQYNTETKQLDPIGEPGLRDRVGEFIKNRKLIGHNSEHDRVWVDASFGFRSHWKADTRKMWHLQASDLLHGHGLKTAQTEILGWSETNETELENHVKGRGGSLSNGDHYLADCHVLGRYAALDALSTCLLYRNLSAFFDKHNYWWFLEWRMSYHPILTEATRIGTPVDLDQLLVAKEKLSLKHKELSGSVREVCAPEIERLERSWANQKVAQLKTEKGRLSYLGAPARWKRFNPNSGTQRSALLHGELGIPVQGKTPTGRPKSDRHTISQYNHPVARHLTEISEVQKNLSFAKGYIDSLRDTGGRYSIHFPYNTAGTVHDRLGGYAPYALNMPFSEKDLMSAFKLPVGFIGIHADLSALEPCMIAAYSKDPTLLKVHRDGLGDVYLDLALRLFPNNLELQREYNPNVPVSSEVKKKFKRERDVCKIVHLAVGYTGTWSTVYKNLNREGFAVTQAEARRLVDMYWQVFSKVSDLEYRLKRMHERDGHLRNIAGRIIQVPEKFQKDTLNRFICSSGHDCLTMWVLEIDKLRKEFPEIGMYPVLPDIHDSTSWACKEEHYEKARWIFEESLRRVNSRLNLVVSLRAEVKPFRTFYGLKGDEV